MKITKGTSVKADDADNEPEILKMRAEDALRTMERAEEHRKDDKLMKAVDECRAKKMDNMARINVKVEAVKPMKIKSRY